MKNMIQFTGKNGEFQIAHLVQQNEWNFPVDRKSTRLNSSHYQQSRMPSSA